jgi:hypothetical protein
MNIKDSYRGCTEEDIMRMGKKELQKAILRIFSLEPRKFAPGDSWAGAFLLPDDIADVFRGFPVEYNQ